MKKLIIAILILSSSMLLTSCLKKPVTLTLAEIHNDSHITTQADYKFAELVEQKTDGEVKINVVCNSAFGSEPEILEKLKNKTNEVDMARLGGSELTPISDLAKVWDMPYIFSDDEHMWSVLNSEVGELAQKDLNKYDLELLCYFDSGVRNIYTKKPINQIEDFRGLRLRTVYSSNQTSDYFASLGVNPVPVNFGDIYSAIEANVIDGAENNFSSYFTAKHYKVAPNVLKAEIKRIPDTLIISNDSMSKLTEEQQKIVRQCAKEASLYQIREWKKHEKELEKELLDLGCVIIEPNPEISQYLKTMANEFYKKYPQYEDIITQIKAKQSN